MLTRSYLDGELINERLQSITVYLKEDGSFWVGPSMKPQRITRSPEPVNYHGVKCRYLWNFHASTVVQNSEADTTTGQAA